MKYILLFFALIAPCRASDWVQSDTVREAVYLAFHCADWSQTLDISEHNVVEKNIYLGRYPVRGDINKYFIATGLLHAGVSYVLPPEYRKAFQFVTIGIEAGTVARNYRIGIGLSF